MKKEREKEREKRAKKESKTEAENQSNWRFSKDKEVLNKVF